jgi:hypothetical protein
VPLECWLIAGALYTALVAAVRTMNVREVLGFPRTLDSRPIETDAVIDIAGTTSTGGLATATAMDRTTA